jgi:hypothetical protein
VSAGYNKQIQLNTRMIKKSEKNKYKDLIRNGGIATAEMPVSVFEKRVKAKAASCENLDKNRTNMRNSLSARKADWNAKKDYLSGLTETDIDLKLAGIERDSSVVAHQNAVVALASFHAANPAPEDDAGCAEAAKANSDAKAALDAATLAASVAEAEHQAACVAYTNSTNGGTTQEQNDRNAEKTVKLDAKNAADNAIGPLITAYEQIQADNLTKVAECFGTAQVAAEAKAAMDAIK